MILSYEISFDRYTFKAFQHDINDGNSDTFISKVQVCNNGGMAENWRYHQVSNIRRASIGNYIVDHSDVVGASPVGAAPTTSSFST